MMRYDSGWIWNSWPFFRLPNRKVIVLKYFLTSCTVFEGFLSFQHTGKLLSSFVSFKGFPFKSFLIYKRCMAHQISHKTWLNTQKLIETVSYKIKNRRVCFGIEVSVGASTIENEVNAFDTCGLVIKEKLCWSSLIVFTKRKHKSLQPKRSSFKNHDNKRFRQLVNFEN